MFEFMTAPRIIFGAGALAQIGALVADMSAARRAFVVTGIGLARAEPLVAHLRAAGVEALLFATNGEPKVETALEGAMQVRAAGCDVVIGFGGGAAIDAGKAIAALATNPGDPLDYLEVIGRAQPLVQPPLPYIAVPTTAGTGSEVTRNAVLASEEKQVKVSLRSPMMIPRIALIDPELQRTLPSAVTASSGMDALTQVIEPYVSLKANPITDAVCREGMMRGGRALRRAYDQPDDVSARADMAVTALFSGMALANAALGAVHGFAGPLGGMYPAPHGAICARLLPIVMQVNLRALRSRLPDSPALPRYEQVACLLTGDAQATADDGVAWAFALRDALGIPGLGAYGVTPAAFDDIAQKALRASSMKGNPLPLTEAEMVEILEQAV
jgi:alcohol dehydrogenase class IV